MRQGPACAVDLTRRAGESTPPAPLGLNLHHGACLGPCRPSLQERRQRVGLAPAAFRSGCHSCRLMTVRTIARGVRPCDCWHGSGRRAYERGRGTIYRPVSQNNAQRTQNTTAHARGYPSACKRVTNSARAAHDLSVGARSRLSGPWSLAPCRSRPPCRPGSLSSVEKKTVRR